MQLVIPVHHKKESSWFSSHPCCRSLLIVQCVVSVSLNTSLYGTLVVIKTTCPGDHNLTWYSQPLVGKAPAGNLLLSAAIVFSGSTFATFSNIATLINLSIFSERLFYRIQQNRIFPLVNAYYRQNQIVLADTFRDKGSPLVLSGDGRCDSPGYSAKYCTYSLMDCDTGFIVDYSLVQVTETGTSVDMDKEGLRRCLLTVREGLNLEIATLATDRHCQITAFMKADYPNINHQYDVWHLAKCQKKLSKAGLKKGHDALMPWIQSISNHLWWSAKTCNKNPDLLIAKWTSIVHRIVNGHEWEGDLFSQCAHEPIDNRNNRKKWLNPNDPAYHVLKQIVTKPSLVRDIAKLNDFCHTGQLEVFHSLLTKYCPKWQHFSYMGMRVCTQLAILDHNYNTDRQQATTFQGRPRYRMAYSKGTKRWVPKTIKEKKQYNYLDFMLEEMVNPEYSVDEVLLSDVEIPQLPRNIAATPQPHVEDTVCQHMTRFNKH